MDGRWFSFWSAVVMFGAAVWLAGCGNPAPSPGDDDAIVVVRSAVSGDHHATADLTASACVRYRTQ
jgi:hypothetical protein